MNTNKMNSCNIRKINDGISQRFVQTAEELRLTGAQLFRDGVVANEQVLSKIKHGWQKPSEKSINLFCKKYDVSLGWMYSGEGKPYPNKNDQSEKCKNVGDVMLLYNTGFDSCLDNKGQLVATGNEVSILFPKAGDTDFWCINYDNSLMPVIMPGDTIALKKLDAWQEYIPGDYICVFVTDSYKMLRKVSSRQDDEQNISIIQMEDGEAVESKIPKNIIVEVYKVVGYYRKL